MATEATVTTRRSAWSRRLREPVGAAGQLFYAAVVAGLGGALLVMAGLATRWAWALAWALAAMFLAVRAAIARKQWPTARHWLGVALAAAGVFAVAAITSH